MDEEGGAIIGEVWLGEIPESATAHAKVGMLFLDSIRERVLLHEPE